MLDTDTKNEIDDQYAIAYAYLSKSLKLEALYAAPFKNKEFVTAESGMIASYEEILRVQSLLNDKTTPVFRGATRFLSDCNSFENLVSNDAVDDLIERSKAYAPLYVGAIGALTNIALALQKDPSLAERIVVIWLGGHPEEWSTNREFNLVGDIKAAQVVMDSHVPLVRIPCKNVAEHFRLSPPELDEYIRPLGPLGQYLATITEDWIGSRVGTKVIWDIIPIAWLITPEWVPVVRRERPGLADDGTWVTGGGSTAPYYVAVDVRVNQILRSLIETLADQK